MITKRTANTVNMIELLEKMNEPLKKVGKSKRWIRHPSISFLNNYWYRHSTKEKGFPVDFLMTFFNQTEPEAIHTITQHFNLKNEEINYPIESLYRPPKNHNNQAVEVYLKHIRFIDQECIDYLINHDLLYQERKYSNCVFIGYDTQNRVNHLHRHSTHLADNDYKGNAPGSDSKYPFNLVGTSDSLYVFESPIDLLSYITLHNENWTEHSYLALCGLSTSSLHKFLTDHPYIQNVVLCLDNDAPGQDATSSILTEMMRYPSVYVEVQTSRYKDFNEDLKALHGLPALEGIKEAFIQVLNEVKKIIIQDFEDSKDKKFKDLMNCFSLVYYGLHSNNLKHSEKATSALIECAGYALLLVRQQYRHLEKKYSIKEMVNFIDDTQPFMMFVETDPLMTGFTKELDILKTIYLTKINHTVDDKHQLIQSLMSLAKRCMVTHVFLLLNKQNERNL
ncbi:DUF3991 and toprim domain-containing protein [Erysipelothrix anatis]|uniref:DUF3991 and toprim domain-containing protein n=1 Tax=Erysipelothrix anatis TaxID=2683713 RepID=UPI00135A06D9|nr:DUF3991 and toprim domain-containing protein [Erysipelothrix anatis]